MVMLRIQAYRGVMPCCYVSGSLFQRIVLLFIFIVRIDP
jgi:hypothetical protein